MGIRIHKDLGYGVDNIKHGRKDWSLVDPRINYKKFEKLHSEAHGMDWKKILEWLKREKEGLIDFHHRHHPVTFEGMERKDEMYEFEFRFLTEKIERVQKEKDKVVIHDTLGSSIVWEGEFGLQNVLLFVPIGLAHVWRRYDDMIDYYEESDKEAGQTNWCKILKVGGFYPWTGWIRFRDPKPGILKPDAKPGVLKTLDCSTYSMLVGHWDKNQNATAKGDALKHFQEDYRPVFPIDLMAVLWFLKDAFTDVDSLVNELRPMIYVHWG